MMDSKIRAVVLVVEDNDLLRPTLVAMLEMGGYTVLQSVDAEDGLTVLHSAQQIDLLVTDVRMPGDCNGEQMVQFARKARPELKVLFITGFVGEMREDWTRKRATQIMLKPFRLNVFLAKVASMLAAPTPSGDPLP